MKPNGKSPMNSDNDEKVMFFRDVTPESTSNEDGEKEDVYQFGVILLQIITGKVMAAASSELGSLKLQLENGLREEPSVLRSLADPSTIEEIYKVASIALSPNVSAQIFMGLMVSAPRPGDISYDQFVRESKGILESLRRRARIMTDGFNSCKNVVCNFTEGAMYSFPQIKLPPKAIQAAKQLLEATGISTVPGSGFGQKEGVFHLRTTILPAEEEMPEIMESFMKFNDEFMSQYGDNFGYSRM
ncbi:hypothetical protein Bca52824_047925 [Brassica carinata]|uniref:Uncharacterized protein n=1 Tax=Brassica carinata TaxID=52824 RepID=A0A8X7UTR9_BRACI|nr:hypothetical protein Bca52824_047925 [Brassica carinata]